jgi:hypothetical protein
MGMTSAGSSRSIIVILDAILALASAYKTRSGRGGRRQGTHVRFLFKVSRLRLADGRGAADMADGVDMALHVRSVTK